MAATKAHTADAAMCAQGCRALAKLAAVGEDALGEAQVEGAMMVAIKAMEVCTVCLSQLLSACLNYCLPVSTTVCLSQLLFACLNYCLPVSTTVCLSQILFALKLTL